MAMSNLMLKRRFATFQWTRPVPLLLAMGSGILLSFTCVWNAVGSADPGSEDLLVATLEHSHNGTSFFMRAIKMASRRRWPMPTLPVDCRQFRVLVTGLVIAFLCVSMSMTA